MFPRGNELRRRGNEAFPRGNETLIFNLHDMNVLWRPVPWISGGVPRGECLVPGAPWSVKGGEWGEALDFIPDSLEGTGRGRWGMGRERERIGREGRGMLLEGQGMKLERRGMRLAERF